MSADSAEELLSLDVPRHMAEGRKLFGVPLKELTVIGLVSLGAWSALRTFQFDPAVPFPVLGWIYLSSFCLWVLGPAAFAFLAWYKKHFPDYSLHDHVIYLTRPNAYSAQLPDRLHRPYTRLPVSAKRAARRVGRLRAGEQRPRYERDMSSKNLSHLLHVQDILDDVVVMTGGLVSVGLRLRPRDADALTAADLNRIYSGCLATFLTAPQDTYFQYLLWRRHATPDDVERALGAPVLSGSPDPDAFAALRRAHKHDRAEAGHLFEAEHYLFLAFRPRPSWRRGSRSPLTRIADAIQTALESGGKGMVRRLRAQHDRMLAAVRRDVAAIRSDLELAGFDAEQLSSEALFELLYNYFNPTRRPLGSGGLDTAYREEPDAPEFYDALPEARPLSIRNQIAASDVWTAEEGALQVDGVWTEVLHLRSLPHQAAPALVEQLAALPFPVWISLNTRVASQAKEISELAAELRITDALRQQMSSWVQFNTTRTREANADLRRMDQKAVRQQDRPLYMNLLVRLEAASLEELRMRRHALETAARRMRRADLGFDTHSQVRLWLAAAPGNCRDDIHYTWTSATCAAALVPAYGRFRGALQPTEHGFAATGRVVWSFLNRRGEIVPVAPFQNALPHSLIIGKAGSGKSNVAATAMLELLQHEDTEVTVLDFTGGDGKSLPYGLGNSASAYPRIANLTGGKHVRLDLTDLPNFYPLAARRHRDEIAPDTVYIDSNIDPDLAQRAVGFLEALALDTKRSETSLPKRMTGLLHAAYLSCLYEHRDPNRPPVLEDFLAALAGEARRSDAAQELLDRLQQCRADSPLGLSLNKREAFDADARFLCFDLAGAEKYAGFDHAVYLLVVNHLYRRITSYRHRHTTKAVWVEEAHKVLRTGPLTEAITSLSPLSRKHRVWLSYLTQDIDDLLDIPGGFGKKVIANTGIHLVLRTARLRDTCDALELNSAEEGLIRGLSQMAFQGRRTHVREGFLKIGEAATVIRVVNEPAHHYFLTTDPAERDLLEAVQAQFGVPGRDVSYARFFQSVAHHYPPGWVETNDVRTLAARLGAARVSAA